MRLLEILVLSPFHSYMWCCCCFCQCFWLLFSGFRFLISAQLSSVYLVYNTLHDMSPTLRGMSLSLQSISLTLHNMSPTLYDMSQLLYITCHNYFAWHVTYFTLQNMSPTYIWNFI